jgi:hypothetical protein
MYFTFGICSAGSLPPGSPGLAGLISTGISWASRKRAPGRAIRDPQHTVGYSFVSRCLGPLRCSRCLSLPPPVALHLPPEPIPFPRPALPGFCLVFSLQTAFKFFQSNSLNCLGDRRYPP